MFRRCGRLKLQFVVVLTLIWFSVIIVLFLLKRRSIDDGANRPHCPKLQQPTTTQHISVAVDKSNNLGAATITKLKTTTQKRTVPDMVNDYYPYVDFSIVFPAITPNLRGPQDLFLLIFVNSAATKHREQRDTIRATWASHESCEHRRATNDIKLEKFMNKRLLVFVVGKSSNAQENERNIEEAKKHNDMLIGNISDNYLNNIVKFYMGILWASTLAPKYILKTDDDVYVRIPGVIQYLVEQKLPNRLYAGETYRVSHVMRDARYKWAVSKKYYPEKNWPRFNAGAFILISMDLVGGLFNYLKERKPFHTDDTYIGVAMRDSKINVTDIPSFYIHGKMTKIVKQFNDCKLLSLVGFAHNIAPKTSKFLHNRVETLCNRNFNVTSCQH